MVVILTFLALILEYSGKFSLGSVTSSVRSLKVGRVFRLIRKAKNLRIIFNTFILILPSLFNIGGLLVLALFIYSVIGM